MRKVVFTLIVSFFILAAAAQQMTTQQYIDTYKDIAVREMKRMGVPASITLAQGVLETESGNSQLVKKSNNHFGIKCKSSWTGGSVYHDDDASGECFRKYDSASESYRDHSNFLRSRDHYAFLFNLAPTDYKGWAYGLKKAGYATNPKYPQMLIKTIEDYNLNQYTLEALEDMPDFDTRNYEDDSENKIVSTVKESISEFKGLFKSIDHVKSTFNGIKAVIADSGTSLLAIATEYGIPLAVLLEFNDLKNDGLLEQSSYVYLENKATEGKQATYTAREKESLYDISQNKGIKLSSLILFNGMEENAFVEAGTTINLKPNKLEMVDNDLPLDSNIKTHEVKPKEGLYSIAKTYNVSVADLKLWNNLSSNDIKVGQKLIVSK